MSSRTITAEIFDAFLKCASKAHFKSQEGALRKFLQNYAEGSDYGDIKATRYFAAFVHLRDDNTQQVIVYLVGGAWCGTGGCLTLILNRV